VYRDSQEQRRRREEKEELPPSGPAIKTGGQQRSTEKRKIRKSFCNSLMSVIKYPPPKGERREELGERNGRKREVDAIQDRGTTGELAERPSPWTRSNTGGQTPGVQDQGEGE